jgi:hypothetical protein
MKHLLPLIVLFISISACNTGTDDGGGAEKKCYEGYKVTYQRDGIIVLQHPDSVKKAVDATKMTEYLKGAAYDPRYGKVIDNKDAYKMIKRFQDSLAKLGDKTSPRFLDFHYPHAQLFLNEGFALESGKEADYAVRLYYANSAEGRITIVMAPVLKVGDKKVSAVWNADATEYKTFNFGSNCPDRCPSGNNTETGLEVLQ